MAKTQNEKKTRTFKAEIIAIIFFALMLLTGGSLVFFNKGDAGTFGLIGNNVSVVLFTLIGYSAYILPVLFGYLSYRFAFREGLALRISIPISLGLLIVASSGLFVLLLGSEVAGGLIGKIGANNLVHFVGLPGSIIILLAILLASLRVGTGISLISFFEKIFFGCRIIIIYGINAYKKIVGLIKAGKKSAETIKEARAEKKAKKEEKKEKEVKRKSPTIVTKPEAKPKKKPATAAQEKFEFLSPEGKFQLPHIDLMTPLPRKMDKVDKQSLLTNSKILEQKLVDFDVNGQVLAVRPGPVVTTYEFEPAPGIKVNKILNLADDLALAMRATSMRILAPIPGKAVVGIEVPNAIRESILLREMLESREFVKNKSKLALAFGKDISGETFVADLAKMPHLLVAGATGAGKSVFINTLILSIL
ncbi:MAG: DNA translocase FtsK 4TM domain-containing protein, partial [Deltaproteobacteria bacterium]|nr:DNA translocase FtsK 4TM domain-containing protein [Deltaproteobacteria bacterium]